MSQFIFALAHSPVAGMGINLSNTQKYIEDAFQGYEPGIKSFIHNVTLNDVQHALTVKEDSSPQVFQFSGHGTEDHLHFFNREGNERRLVEHEAFAHILAEIKSLKLVIFDCCLSHKLARACVAAGIPAAIGTSSELADKSSHELCDYFWKAIVKGGSIHQALTQANKLYEADQTFSDHYSTWELFLNPEYPQPKDISWDLTGAQTSKRQKATEDSTNIKVANSKNVIATGKMDVKDSSINFGK